MATRTVHSNLPGLRLNKVLELVFLQGPLSEGDQFGCSPQSSGHLVEGGVVLVPQPAAGLSPDRIEERRQQHSHQHSPLSGYFSPSATLLFYVLNCRDLHLSHDGKLHTGHLLITEEIMEDCNTGILGYCLFMEWTYQRKLNQIRSITRFGKHPIPDHPENRIM